MGLFDSFGSSLNLINQGSSMIQNLANTIYGYGEMDRSKELAEYTQELNRDSLRQNPSAYIQGLKNAGLSPQTIQLGGIVGGSSVPSASQWNSRSAENRAANTNQMLAFNELANSAVNRDLSRAQIRKEDAQAKLFDLQAQGQDLQNIDYQGALSTGGILGNQSIGQFLSNDFTVDSNDTQKLYNRLNRMVVLGQINDPVVVQALTSLPEKEVKEIITRTAKFAQEILVGKSQVGLNRMQQFNFQQLGRYNNALWRGQQYTNNHILPNQKNILWQQLRPFGRNPYSMEGAITDINEFWKEDSFMKGFGRLGRGLGNYILNGIPSLLGSGVQWSNNRNMSNTLLDIANMNNNKTITNTTNKGFQSTQHVTSHPSVPRGINNRRRRL